MKTLLLAAVVAGSLTGFGIANAQADDPFGTAGATSVYNNQGIPGDPYATNGATEVFNNQGIPGDPYSMNGATEEFNNQYAPGAPHVVAGAAGSQPAPTPSAAK